MSIQRGLNPPRRPRARSAFGVMLLLLMSLFAAVLAPGAVAMAQETVEETAQETVEETAQETVEETAQETVEETAEVEYEFSPDFTDPNLTAEEYEAWLNRVYPNDPTLGGPEDPIDPTVGGPELSEPPLVAPPPQNFGSDPGYPGSREVATMQYDLPDGPPAIDGVEVEFPDGLEFRAEVHYPISYGGGESFPLIVHMHGRTFTTHKDGVTSFDWPPDPDNGRFAVPSYLGFRQTAEHLASHGFVFVSISANGIAGNRADEVDNGKPGQIARAKLFHHHLRYLKQANASDDFETDLTGVINFDQIALMGHSRGAEAAIEAAILEGPNPEAKLGPGVTSDGPLPNEFGIDAVFAVTPSRILQTGLTDVPLGVMVSYSDGDVGAIGVQHYDAALYYNYYGQGSPDLAPKHLINVMGANHNFYNSVWTPGMPDPISGTTNPVAHDDALKPRGGFNNCHTNPGAPHNARLTPAEQVATLNAYSTAFLGAYLKGETANLPVLTGEDIRAFPSLLFGNQEVLVSYHGPHDTNVRLDVNRFDLWSDIHANPDLSLYNSNAAWIAGGPGPTIFPTDASASSVLFRGWTPDAEPHTRLAHDATSSGALRIVKVGGDQAAILEQRLRPGQQNVSQFEAVQFRLGVHFEIAIQTDQAAEDLCRDRALNNEFWQEGSHTDVELAVRLIDADGVSRDIPASQYSAALFTPPGNVAAGRVVMNQVRVPLEAFAQLGIDLTNIVEVEIVVPAFGDVQVSDLQFASS